MERIQRLLSPVLAQMRGSLRARGWTNPALSGVPGLCLKNANLACLLPFSMARWLRMRFRKSAEGPVVGLEAWLQVAEAMGAGLSVSTKHCPPHYPQTQSPLPASPPLLPLCSSLALSPRHHTGLGKFPADASVFISFPLPSAFQAAPFPLLLRGHQEPGNPSPHQQIAI